MSDDKRGQNIGEVVEVIGPVVEAEFETGDLPEIHDAIKVIDEEHDREVTIEIMNQVGDSRVKGVAMSSTDGLKRGMKAIHTGAPISVPVGEECLGRIFNVLGEPIDKKGEVETDKEAPIHRDPPAYEEQATSTEIFETGIKVVD